MIQYSDRKFTCENHILKYVIVIKYFYFLHVTPFQGLEVQLNSIGSVTIHPSESFFIIFTCHPLPTSAHRGSA